MKRIFLILFLGTSCLLSQSCRTTEIVELQPVVVQKYTPKPKPKPAPKPRTPTPAETTVVNQYD